MELIPLQHVPIINGPTHLAPVLLQALRDQQLTLQKGDILVIAHTLVSKAEGKMVKLADVAPSAEAYELAALTEKDPRLVELILQESVGIVRAAPGVLITEHRLGTVSANAAIDRSNAGPGGEWVVLLPDDPDASAARLRSAIKDALGIDIGIIISDTHGRPFRLGAVGVAIGVAGLIALRDWRGETDLYGYVLQTSDEAVADELAAAASLLMGQSKEGVPAVIVRGLSLPPGNGTACSLVRPRHKDLFRNSAPLRSRYESAQTG